VGTSQPNSSSYQRLVHSRGAKAQYTALSHCWGGNIACVLNWETLIPFQKCIPNSVLPANFQDAITITRQLGLQYLWIDSLCILQDSGPDWEQESKNMGLLYRNATVTISALVSRRSTCGILKRNSIVPSPEPVIIGVSSESISELKVTVGRTDGGEESLRRLDIEAPLSKRGWVLQETVLSRRHLFYRSSQENWRCAEGFKSLDGLPSANRTPERL
jgi:hypothetical protein